MATKLISSFLILITMSCYSQESIINLSDISIDSINLNYARYKLKDFGQITKEMEWKEEFEEYTRQFTEIQYDSIEVLYYTNNSEMKFIYWIKIYGSNHILRIRNNILKVNENVNELKNEFLDVYLNYLEFNQRKLNNKDIIYFGKPILITNLYNKNESYLGEIKFGIKDGIIKEILIDLRTEGDYD
jgi:hypothetical protein